MPMWY